MLEKKQIDRGCSSSVCDPDWWTAARPVAAEIAALQVESGDAEFILDNEEGDFSKEWRVARVPVNLVIDTGMAPEPGRLDERLDNIRSANEPLHRPIYELQLDGRLKILDGWHRLQVSRERNEASVEALVCKKPGLNPFVVENDGDVSGGLYAEFDDEAYLLFYQDRKGNIRLQSAHSSEAIRGRDMLNWLSTMYGRPIVVNEVTTEAAGFWERMQSEGRIAQWSERRFTGVTVAVTSNGSSGLRMESAQKATKFLKELPRKAAPHA